MPLLHAIDTALIIEEINPFLDNDTLVGTDLDDLLDGGEGEDQIWGNLGNDTLLGGNGHDYLNGGAGNDSLEGGEGYDNLQGGDGDDQLFGGAANDTMSGGKGNDLVDGGAGNEYMFGADGADTMKGGEGDDFMSGDAGNDKLFGDAGNDTIAGGLGNDTIEGGAGGDRLTGYGGNDLFVMTHAAAPYSYTPTHDTITDFQIGTRYAHDRIDLSVLMDQTTFTGYTAAQAKYEGYLYVTQYGTPGTDDFGTRVYVDRNGSAADGYLRDWLVADLEGVAANQLGFSHYGGHFIV